VSQCCPTPPPSVALPAQGSARLESPDDHTLIGMALSVGWGEGGVSLWRLTVHGVEVPGRWIVVDREFWPEGIRPERTSERECKLIRPAPRRAGPGALGSRVAARLWERRAAVIATTGGRPPRDNPPGMRGRPW
jgi:hypothetical protein